MYALLFKTINWALNSACIWGFSPHPQAGSHTPLKSASWSTSQEGQTELQLLSCCEQCWSISHQITTWKKPRNSVTMKHYWSCSRSSQPTSGSRGEGTEDGRIEGEGGDVLSCDSSCSAWCLLLFLFPRLTLEHCPLGPCRPETCPHRVPLWVLCAFCQSECPSAASLTDEVWTMENKVGARGASRLNEPIFQIIRLVDMLIFLP